MFLPEPSPSAAVDAAYADDVEHDGYVYHHTRLWCYRPAPAPVREAVTFGRAPAATAG